MDVTTEYAGTAWSPEITAYVREQLERHPEYDNVVRWLVLDLCATIDALKAQLDEAEADKART